MIIKDIFVIGVDYCVCDDKCRPDKLHQHLSNIQKGEKSIEGSSNGCECGRIRLSKLEYICNRVEELEPRNGPSS